MCSTAAPAAEAPTHQVTYTATRPADAPARAFPPEPSSVPTGPMTGLSFPFPMRMSSDDPQPQAAPARPPATNAA